MPLHHVCWSNLEWKHTIYNIEIQQYCLLGFGAGDFGRNFSTSRKYLLSSSSILNMKTAGPFPSQKNVGKSLLGYNS